MRFLPLALGALLTLPALPHMVAAQSAEVAAPSAKPAITISADWVLSMEAKTQRQLAQEREGTTAALHACPVGFWAAREGSLGLRRVKNPNQNPGPGLDLTFRANERKVVEADITVFGWSRELRMIPAAYPLQTSENFVLNGTNSEPLGQELIWMKRLGVVNSVELTRVAFSDGTTWAQDGDLHCTVNPSKMVLVNALK